MPPVPSSTQHGRTFLSSSVRGAPPLTEVGFTGSRNVLIHWAQESFDQASLVREFVKWDYELRNFAQLETVVDRALAIATSEPSGPVYLTLPREVLAESHEALTISTVPRQQAHQPNVPDTAQVKEVATLIAQATNPLIITSGAGRDPQAVEALIAFAESFAIPVVVGVGKTHLNFPTSHPLHLGFDSTPYLKEADVVLVIDTDVPWLPTVVSPKETACVIQLGYEPLYSRYPIRGHAADIALAAQPTATLRLLTEEMQPYQEQAAQQIANRFETVRAEHKQQREAWGAHAEAVKEDKPVDAAWLSACINQVLDAEAIVVNEYDLVPTQVDLTVPGSFFGPSPRRWTWVGHRRSVRSKTGCTGRKPSSPQSAMAAISLTFPPPAILYPKHITYRFW